MKYYYIFFAVILLASGCNLSDRNKLIEVNNKIVSINDSLFRRGEAWGSEVGTAWATKDFSRLDSMHADMMTYIDRKTVELRKLDDIGGSEQLRQAEIAFLKFEKDLLDPASIFGSFDSNTTEETFMAAFQQVAEASKEEKTRLLEVKRVQEEFAKRNNIPLRAGKE